VKEAIFRTVWELRKSGYAEATVNGYGCKLKILSKLADLNSPDLVREVVALKKCSVAFKEALVNAYSHYVKFNGLTWTKPCYPRQRGLPYVASSEQVNQIISRASRRYALVFSVLRDTGLRPVELSSVTLKNVDLLKGVVTVKSAKAGNPRALVLKPSTLAMLNEYVHRHNFGLDTQLFPSPSASRHAWERNRNDVAKKLHQPELSRIRLYDLRHFFATMLYHRTKDILYVKEQLGHKRIENTLVYTHLVTWANEEYVCKAAKTAEEAVGLIEQGFTYVATAPEGFMLFRKPK
jgi:integrase